MLLVMMKALKDFRAAALAVVLVLAACATWRWSGSPPRDERTANAPLAGRSADGELHPRPVETPPEIELRLSTAPAAVKPQVIVPPTPAEKLKTAVYPADLGPETVDVSGYPPRIRTDYQIYARVCAKCHTLARANYSQHVERAWWRLYITRMRARAAWKGSRLSRDEVRAILDFLSHDSRVRKRERRKEFEKTTAELERRFDAELALRLQRLQKGRSVLDGR